MKVLMLLVPALWAGVVVAQLPGPTANEPLRNTFVVATESVLDSASTLDLKAPAAQFDPQMQNFKTLKNNLDQLASDEHEQEVAAAVDDFAFQLAACRVQAIDGADITTCNQRLQKAREQVMQDIGKRKNGDRWEDASSGS